VVLFAPWLAAIGLMTIPSNIQSGFEHTLTTSARHRLDLIAYRARPQLTLDYSGYHHWPKQGHVVVHVAIGAMSVDERAIKSTIRFAK
jgi:hypothetical protein